MDFIEDFGLYLVRALGIVSRWLANLTEPVPWPLVVAALALPILAVLRVVVWFLRGAVWPVRCKYPATTKSREDKACRAPVLGEWRYCRDHSREFMNSRGHVVNPRLPRWKTIRRGKEVDRDDVRAAGTRVSLLFHRGFARTPRQVLEAAPDVWDARTDALRTFVLRLLRRPVEDECCDCDCDCDADADDDGGGDGPTEEELERYRGVSHRAVRADEALVALRVMLPLALVVTAATTFVSGPLTVVVEYAALLLLWIAVEIARCGLMRTSEDDGWRLQVVKGVARAFAVVAGLALIGVGLDEYGIPFARELLGLM